MELIEIVKEMPIIIIKDYTWRETEDYVIVYVPFKSRPKKLDFLVIDNYVKVCIKERKGFVKTFFIIFNNCIDIVKVLFNS